MRDERTPTRGECLAAAGKRTENALRIAAYPPSRLRVLAVQAEVRGFWRALHLAGVGVGGDGQRTRHLGGGR